MEMIAPIIMQVIEILINIVIAYFANKAFRQSQKARRYASFNAQVAMFPGMVAPTYFPANSQQPNANSYIAEAIAHYSAMGDVLAWKMPGAGGGGYLALVVKEAKAFVAQHAEAFELHIRRE